MFVVKASSDFAAKRVEYLYDAMKQKKKYDTLFIVRGLRFYVHLVVLSACSEFFWTNKDQLEKIFSPFDFDVIDAILKYCYTGEISIADRHYDKLMELANRLEVKIPPRYETVDLSNCLEVLKSTEDSDLKTEAMDLTLNNFETLHKTKDFLNLPLFNVNEILKSNYLNVPSEEDVFNAVKLWANHDNANRKSDLAQLMRSFFIDEVLTFCHSCADCMTTLRQAVKDKKDKSFVPRETPRRKIKGYKMALVGGWDIDTANTIDIFDGLKNSWTLSKNIGINKYYFASVLVGDWIVIIGGKKSLLEPMTSVEYNSCGLSELAVTLRRGSSTDVYAIGGFGGGFLSSVERWSSDTGDWEIIAPLLVAVSNQSASVIVDKICITGGLTSGRISTNKVQMYSVETNSWTYRAQMIQGRYNHSSVAFKGKLYVAGGFDYQTWTYLDSVEHYDPNANVWTAFIKLPEFALGISLGCFQNKLFSLGGFTSDVWEYDETNKTWKASTSLSRERRYAVAHVIPYDSII
ncbi:kelch-like protein 7 [Arctopsyche grandis]|uniref:kelch-like protein 7 n=1 Tax=Arctopsyche grandis TaxID=121162 RepID=UPI00406D9477